MTMKVISLILFLGMFWEWLEIGLNQNSLQFSLKKAFFLSIGFLFFIFSELQIENLELFFHILLLRFFSFYFKGLKTNELKGHLADLFVGLSGFFYLGLAWTYLVKLKQLPYGTQWILLFFFLNWCTDIVAYFVGKKFGKRRLSPLISPKKTWEGTLGGTLAAIVLGGAYTKGMHLPLSVPMAMILSALVSMGAQMGDLLESLLKRAFGVKDSGSLLPGHGACLTGLMGWFLVFH